jgi:DNA repair exonuclease SbcCD ATPase subunit
MVKIGNIELGEFPLLLAPMEDVSDPPFRAVCKMNGADLMYTEFISSEGLIRHAKKSVQKLDIYNEERKQLREKHQEGLKSIEEELEKKKLEVKNLLIQNQETIEALNNEKKQKEQFVTTKNSEIEGLKNIIEDLTKEKNEVNGAHSRLWDKYTQQEAECDRAVWHKKLFAIAFLACLASLIGCVLKIQHVFV